MQKEQVVLQEYSMCLHFGCLLRRGDFAVKVMSSICNWYQTLSDESRVLRDRASIAPPSYHLGGRDADAAADAVDYENMTARKAKQINKTKKMKKNKRFQCNRCPARFDLYTHCIRHICLIHFKKTLQEWVGHGKRTL